jgi:hypothetical protein
MNPCGDSETHPVDHVQDFVVFTIGSGIKSLRYLMCAIRVGIHHAHQFHCREGFIFLDMILPKVADAYDTNSQLFLFHG